MTMNTEERTALTQFLDQLRQAQGLAKDPDADALIRAAVAQQSDASYLLVQRCLLQDRALAALKGQLEQAQQEIQQLQNQVQGTRQPASGGFLNDAAWGATPVRPAPQPAPGNAGWPPPAAAAAPSRGASAAGSFLGTAAAAAAGAVGGAFLFQGIESLLGHHGGSSGLFGGGNQPTENVTVNNFFEDGPGSGDRLLGDSLSDADLDHLGSLDGSIDTEDV
jgi:uncharacterized protein